MPRLIARAMACVRVLESSLRRIAWMWFLMVQGLQLSSSAISELDLPFLIRFRISYCLGVTSRPERWVLVPDISRSVASTRKNALCKCGTSNSIT